MAEAYRRELHFTSFDEVLTDVRHLQAGGYTALGTWNLSELTEHLAIFFEGAVHGFPIALPWPINAILRRLYLEKILKSGRMRRGVKVPKQLLPSAKARDASDGIPRLERAIDGFRAHTGEYHPAPAFGRLTRDEWTAIQLVHCSHHLSFLVPNTNGR